MKTDEVSQVSHYKIIINDLGCSNTDTIRKVARGGVVINSECLENDKNTFSMFGF